MFEIEARGDKKSIKTRKNVELSSSSGSAIIASKDDKTMISDG
jgi:hypothetical protein